MQFADLMRLFREGQNEGRKRGYVSQGACDAEGIAAVVRALRDEVLQSPSLDDEGMVTVVDDIFDQILGAAGDEAAGRVGDTKHPDVTSPAADPAPAVCEWTPISEFDTVIHYSTPHGVKNDLHLWRGLKCSACHAPIKFTEAK